MSVEQVVDEYLNAARQILGSTSAPPGPTPPTAVAELPSPEWTGNAHDAAIEATEHLQQARSSLQTAAANVATITETANQIAHEATIELDSITEDWQRDKAALSAMPNESARDAALLAAAQRRIAEVITLTSATTARYHEEANKVRQQAAQLPHSDTDPTPSPDPAAAPPKPQPPPTAPPPGTAGPSSPTLPTGPSAAAETLMPAAAMMPSALAPAMAAPAAAMPLAGAIPAAAAAPLGGLSSLMQPGSAASPTAPHSGTPDGATPGPITGELGNLTLNSSPKEVLAAVISEALRRGYSLDQALACGATMMQESGGNPRAVSPNGLWIGPFQQDTSYPGRENPNTAILEFFNRLDAKGGPNSPDIWKTIFWLQQAPAADSAEAAYANGRQAYLSEIKSQLGRVTQMYQELTENNRRVLT